MNPTTVYLVRHGENHANVRRELSSRHVDYDLTGRGREQARQLAAHFAGQSLHAIYASPLKRAQQTAAPIAAAHGLEVHTLEGLREVEVGDLEVGQTSENLAERWAADRAVVCAWVEGWVETRYPGGENYVEATARGMAGLAEAARGRAGETVVLVGHSGLYQMLLPILLGDREAALKQRNIPLGGFSELHVRALRPLACEVRVWAHGAHLSGEALRQPERPTHLRSEDFSGTP